MALPDDDRRSPTSVLRYSTNRYPGFGLRQVTGYSAPSAPSSPAPRPNKTTGKGARNPLWMIRAEEQKNDGRDRRDRIDMGRPRPVGQDDGYLSPSQGLSDISDVGRGGMLLASLAGGVTGLPVGVAVGGYQAANNIGVVNDARNSVGLSDMGVADSAKTGISANSAREHIETLVDNDARDGGAPGYGATEEGPLGDYSQASIDRAASQSDAQAAENDAQRTPGNRDNRSTSSTGGKDWGRDAQSGGRSRSVRDDFAAAEAASSESGGNSSGGGGGSSRVICTHMMRLGLMDKTLWRADLTYTAEHASPVTVRGYHFWAIPYVRMMRRDDVMGRMAVRVMAPIAHHRAEELAYQLGLRPAPNYAGKVVRAVLEPLSWVIGLFVGQQDWQKLYDEEGKSNGLVL